MLTCTCPDWQNQFSALVTVYSAATGFEFCPWCGQPLPVGRPLTTPRQRDEKLLAQFNQRIKYDFTATDEWGMPDNPNMFVAARSVIDYREQTGDIQGTLELMLTFVESGNQFTNRYGDINEPFYEGLELMLDDFRDLLKKHPDLYATPNLSLRVARLVRQTRHIGWGYGDYVQEVVEDIQKQFGDV